MLSNQHFYHRIIRKVVVGFGTLFNNIKLYRYAKDGVTEFERITVPLSYASKEKFYARLAEDPSLAKEVQLTLPRLSFEMTSVAYDPLRKISTYNHQFFPNADGDIVNSMPISPYNFNFDLYAYVRNTEDGTQIVEQILPYFSPDYTVTIDLSNLVDLKVDMPIILNSINYEQNYVGTSDTVRNLIWNLNFTVKGYMFGPVNQSGKIIRTATANTFTDPALQNNERVLNMGTGSGDYKIGELAYEGARISTANSTGYVKEWDNVTKQLYLTEVVGVIQTGKKMFGAVTNTAYTINSYDINNQQLVKTQVTPDPTTANANTAFGFIETTQEYPNII